MGGDTGLVLFPAARWRLEVREPGEEREPTPDPDPGPRARPGLGLFIKMGQ